jgi:thioredoxin-like negative regulator of GroEL
MLTVKRYTATWCQPCKQLAPIFEALQSEMNNEREQIVFQTIDVDMNKEAAMENGVSSVPTVILEKNGQQVYRFSGVLAKSVIAGIIKNHL